MRLMGRKILTEREKNPRMRVGPVRGSNALEELTTPHPVDHLVLVPQVDPHPSGLFVFISELFACEPGTPVRRESPPEF